MRNIQYLTLGQVNPRTTGQIQYLVHIHNIAAPQCYQRKTSASARTGFLAGVEGHVPVNAASFATENAPKCTISMISRVKILLVAKSSLTGLFQPQPPCSSQTLTTTADSASFL